MLKFRIHLSQIDQLFYDVEAPSQAEAIAVARERWKQADFQPVLLGVDLIPAPPETTDGRE